MGATGIIGTGPGNPEKKDDFNSSQKAKPILRLVQNGAPPNNGTMPPIAYAKQPHGIGGANGSAPMPAMPGGSGAKIGSIRRGDVSAYEEFRIKFSCANAGGGGPAVTSLKNPSASIESASFAQPGQY